MRGESARIAVRVRMVRPRGAVDFLAVVECCMSWLSACTSMFTVTEVSFDSSPHGTVDIGGRSIAVEEEAD